MTFGPDGALYIDSSNNEILRIAPEPWPIAYWSFDNAGDPSHDDSGNGHNGTVNGAVSVIGKCGKALSFDGSGDYVYVPDSPSLNPSNAITIAAWIRPYSFVSSWTPVVTKSNWESGSPTTTKGYVLEFNQSNSGIRFYIDGPGNTGAMTDVVAVPLNEWTHVVGVYDGATVRLYVNNIAYSPVNCSIDIPSSGGDLYIGRSFAAPNRYFNGLMDEVRIYDRALNTAEIEELYTTCPEPEWSFVQMTDTQFGSLTVWKGPNLIQNADTYLATAIYKINHSTPKPDFILDTGDIADHLGFLCWSTSGESYYSRYLTGLKSLDPAIKLYAVPGNHDRYTYGCIKPECLQNFPDGLEICILDLSLFNDYINQKRPGGTEDLVAPYSYTFEHQGLKFIGLDTGSGEKDGELTQTQWLALEGVDKEIPKVLFMHHPSLGVQQEDFQTYCETSNVQLVLAGHTHKDANSIIQGVQYIQTPSTTGAWWPFMPVDEPGYRQIDVINGKTHPKEYAHTTLLDMIVAALYSPANLHIYDSNGRHVGIIDSNEAERGIPDSFYFSHQVIPIEDGNETLPERIIVFDPCDDYLYEVVGKERGTYRLVITSTEDGNDIVFEANGIPTLPGAVHQYIVDWDRLKAGEEGVIIDIDTDGDGTFERTITSDSNLTPAEFDAPMTVTVLMPGSGDAVQDGVILTADANDADGIDKVYFYVREPNDGNGLPIGKEDLAGVFNSTTGKWEYNFNTTQLQDGYYVVLAKGVDKYGNEGWSMAVPFSIRNWAIIKMLPSTSSSKAGRTMPVKFSLRIASSVDPKMPFVYNDELEIRIYDKAKPSVILQRSVFGSGSTNYRIDTIAKMYMTNFKTKTTPATYVVEVWRPAKNFKVGSFTFSTVK
jgi:predicted MPP superfamily phosphohydrolase